MFQIAACAKWGAGHPDWRTLTLSINDRPVSPQITQCLVSDRNIPSVVVAQGDVMLILKPEVLKDSVASTAIRCLQISCGLGLGTRERTRQGQAATLP